MDVVLYAGLTSFVLVLVSGPVLIPYLRRLRIGQTIRTDGPASHLGKAGTPTMGGLMFIAATAIAVLGWGQASPPLLVWLLVTLAFCVLGFADDYLKVVRKQPLGLRARQKLIGQILIGLGLYGVVTLMDLGTWVRVPLLQTTLELGAWYAPFVVLLLMATSNAVNLTDGLDGLAAGASVIAFSVYVFIAAAFGHADLAIAAASIAGGCAAFLFFNAHPAQVMMGDTGSMALGAALGSLAVLTKTELLLPIVGGLFVIEALSVIVQVLYFRLTNGRRLLRMSPLHHHFELSGWSEPRVVVTFWAVGVGFAACALISFRGFGG